MADNVNVKDSLVAGKSVSLMAIQDTKAGMAGLNKEKINLLLYEASKDTLYFKHEQERDKRIDDQVKKMMKDWSTYTDPLKCNALVAMEKARHSRGYERQARDLSQIIVHIDMDMFFAAVEMRDNPNLRDKPMAVGSNRMISTSNYIARRFGVRAAMAGFIGKKLCPDLLLVPCDMAKYRAVSKVVMSILAKYDQDLTVMGCDEAYLNLTNYVSDLFLRNNQDWKDSVLIENKETGEKVIIPQIWDLVEQTVVKIRNEIFEATQLTASAGIAPTTLLAKICSDYNKPNGQFTLRGSSFEHVQAFVGKLDVRKVSGIGPAQEKILKALNIITIKDLWEKRNVIHLLFKPASIDFYLRVSLGLGSSNFRTDQPTKSTGRSSSFQATNDVDLLQGKLLELCKEVEETMVEDGLKGKTLTLQMEKASFDSCVKTKRLASFTSDHVTIFQVAKATMKSILSLDKATKWRLLGVRMSSFDVNTRAETIDGKRQMTLDQFFTKKNLKVSVDIEHKLDHIEEYDDDDSNEDKIRERVDLKEEDSPININSQKVNELNLEVSKVKTDELNKLTDNLESDSNDDPICVPNHDCGDDLNTESDGIEYFDDVDISPDEFICTLCSDSFTEFETFDEHYSICLDESLNESGISQSIEDNQSAKAPSSQSSQLSSQSDYGSQNSDFTSSQTVDTVFTKRLRTEPSSPNRIFKMIKLCDKQI